MKKKILFDQIDQDLIDANRWSIDQYVMRVENRTTVYLHAKIAERFLGERPHAHYVDHINRDKLDNRRSNLRYLSPVESARNTSVHRDNSSGFKGVSWNKQKARWRATICIESKWKHLGNFKSISDAVKARAHAEETLWK